MTDSWFHDARREQEHAWALELNDMGEQARNAELAEDTTVTREPVRRRDTRRSEE